MKHRVKYNILFPLALSILLILILLTLLPQSRMKRMRLAILDVRFVILVSSIVFFIGVFS